MLQLLLYCCNPCLPKRLHYAYAYHKTYLDWLKYETALTFIDVVTKNTSAYL